MKYVALNTAQIIDNKLYKSYNKKIFITFLVIFLFIILFNFLIDPFAIFSSKSYFFNKNKSDLKRQERLTKILSLKQKNKIDTIFLGSSRVDFSISDEYYNKLTGRNAFNLAMQGARFYENEYLIEQALKIQPNIKKIIIGIDYDFYYIKDKKDLSILLNYNKNFVETYASILFSKDVIGASFLTLIKSLNNNYHGGFSSNGMKNIFVNNNIGKSFSQTINQYKETGKNFNDIEPDLKDLKNLIKKLRNQNIEVVIYLQPVHSTMYEIIKQNNALDSLLKFKYELAKIQPFYDFYYPSEFSNEEIKADMQYFFETSHCTYIVGNKILDKICKNTGNYGYLATTENVKQKHNEFVTRLAQWEKDNVQWIKNIETIRGN